MRIGEFAKICQTRISVLRHYDKVGLITPAFIDRFTGYRYYAAEQIEAFRKVSALKKAGFSLKEIKALLLQNSVPLLLAQIERKREEHWQLLAHLEEAKKILMGENSMTLVSIVQKENGMEMRAAPIKNPVDQDVFQSVCRLLEKEAAEQNYQRVSGFLTYGEPYSDEITVAIRIVLLGPDLLPLQEDINRPFTNDDVVGKWEVLGDFAIKEDFFANPQSGKTDFGGTEQAIYFLPGGERYWCFGWTKGFLLCQFGGETSANPYTVEEIDGQRLMFVEYKSYYYRRGGRPTVLVLRQTDQKEYKKEALARRDDFDLPFANDPAVLGRWRSVAFIRKAGEFNPETREAGLFFESIDFQEGGRSVAVYGGNAYAGQRWVRGFVLHPGDQTASAYEIRRAEKQEFLLLEWKSGDYLYGGRDPAYYVFVRDE